MNTAEINFEQLVANIIDSLELNGILEFGKYDRLLAESVILTELHDLPSNTLPLGGGEDYTSPDDDYING